MTYQDQIKSPKWQKKRLEILEQNRFSCEECETEDKQLHVHHVYYKKGKKIWDYENYELRCLCDSCHAKSHALTDKILESLGIMEIVAGEETKEQVLGYAQGLLGVAHEKNPSEHYMSGFVEGCGGIDIEERFKALSKILNPQSDT